jgi:hypothetical protein
MNIKPLPNATSRGALSEVSGDAQRGSSNGSKKGKPEKKAPAEAPLEVEMSPEATDEATRNSQTVDTQTVVALLNESAKIPTPSPRTYPPIVKKPSRTL